MLAVLTKIIRNKSIVIFLQLRSSGSIDLIVRSFHFCYLDF